MLKKIVLTLAMVAFAANAFATSAVGVPTGITFLPSKNVLVAYDAGAITAGDNVVYAIASKNTAGDKIYGATNGSSAIGYKSSNAGTALVAGDVPAKPTTISDSALAGFSIL